MSEYQFPKDQWVWMPHAAHFICGSRCQFHLATYVGGFIVSSVGEMPIIIPEIAKIMKKRVGSWDEIGYGRTYETMVFKAQPSINKCCPYEIVVEDEVDGGGYNDADSATVGHLALCDKWSKVDPDTFKDEE